MHTPHFRAGAVTVVSRSDGLVLAFERADPRGQWQLPQGGLEPGETPRQAAWRELTEETGLSSVEVEMMGEYPRWTVYEYPFGTSQSNRLGAAHRWFFFRVRSDDVVPVPDGREFVAWKWCPVEVLVAEVVDFKQPGYREVLGTGEPLTGTSGSVYGTASGE
jgi:putative (di)nucleoside polyphosphate hydrolase